MSAIKVGWVDAYLLPVLPHLLTQALVVSCRGLGVWVDEL
jgi:hypothetical protein